MKGKAGRIPKGGKNRERAHCWPKGLFEGISCLSQKVPFFLSLLISCSLAHPQSADRASGLEVCTSSVTSAKGQSAKNTPGKYQQSNYFYFTILFTFTTGASISSMYVRSSFFSFHSFSYYSLRHLPFSFGGEDIFSWIPLKGKSYSTTWQASVGMRCRRYLIHPLSGFRDNAYAYHFLPISS